jgi:Tat protein translocase TatB subunit
VFEVGFSELLLIMALALIVLGPEKLPKVASQIGRWMGRARAMARQFREQLEEEASLEPTTRRPTTPATPVYPPGSVSTTVSPTVTPAVDPVVDPVVPAADGDTRHNDYAGAEYTAPVEPASATSDLATPAAVNHEQRGP